LLYKYFSQIKATLIIGFHPKTSALASLKGIFPITSLLTVQLLFHSKKAQ